MWAHQCLLLLPAELIACLGKIANPVGLFSTEGPGFALTLSGDRVSTLGIVLHKYSYTSNRCSNPLEKSARAILKFLVMYRYFLSLYCPNWATQS